MLCVTQRTWWNCERYDIMAYMTPFLTEEDAELACEFLVDEEVDPIQSPHDGTIVFFDIVENDKNVLRHFNAAVKVRAMFD